LGCIEDDVDNGRLGGLNEAGLMLDGLDESEFMFDGLDEAESSFEGECTRLDGTLAA